MKEPRIMQIIPAHDTVAVFGRREVAAGTIKKQIAERLPVICWALVDDSEMYIMGMVAQEGGEIILVNQQEDFLEYESASGTLERLREAIDKYGIPKSVMVDTGNDEYWASQEISEICSPVGKVRDRRILRARSNLRNCDD